MVEVVAGKGLEEPGQGGVQRLAGDLLGTLGEQGAPLVVLPGRQELAGQRQHRPGARVRPLHGLAQALQVEVVADRPACLRHTAGQGPLPFLYEVLPILGR